MQLAKKLFGTKRDDRLHSIAALLVGRRFEGSFDVNDAAFRFTYSPSMTRLVGRSFEAVGRFSVTDSKGAIRTRENVTAKLISAQGGIGAAPPRPSLAALQASDAPNPQQSSISEGATGSGRPLPQVESTDRRSFCGVLYFQLQPLDGRAFTVPRDMRRVQLNVRLLSTDETTRTLHGLYSGLVESLCSKEVNERAAAVYIGELNRLLVKG
jgi:hypothetical protein